MSLSRKTPTVRPAVIGSDDQGHWTDHVRKRVGGLEYGSVQITVHDGRVTLIESTEKFRVSDPRAPGRNVPERSKHLST